MQRSSRRAILHKKYLLNQALLLEKEVKAKILMTR